MSEETVTEKRETTYKCLDVIYYQAKAFAVAGHHLLESKDNSAFVPAMINICLAVELYLKSLDAKTVYSGKLHPSGLFEGDNDDHEIVPVLKKSHKLSEIFGKLQQQTQDELKKKWGANNPFGGLLENLKKHDDSFMTWRYVYESKGATTIASHPLIPICNLLHEHCTPIAGRMVGVTVL